VDGTVTDNLTGLVWLANADCNGLMNWTEALEWANRLADGCTDCGGFEQDCGLADGSSPGEWRLPNIKEYQSLVTLGFVGPAIPDSIGNGQCGQGDPFVNVCSACGYYHHSSTTDLASPHHAFAWDTFNGTEFRWPKDFGERAWALRGPLPGVPPVRAGPVERTGQTTCFTPLGTVTDCTGTGQDGDHVAGIVHPNPRFVNNGDGTVTDRLSGLVWLQDANCDDRKSWAQGLHWANRLFDGCIDCGGAENDCGLSDGSRPGQWRMPNIRELQTLAHFGYSFPALSNTSGDDHWTPGDPFEHVKNDRYASSTTYLDLTSWSFYLEMSWGYAEANNSKTNETYIWPVRGGPIFHGGFESGDCTEWTMAAPQGRSLH
jgi:hypothetical protein